MRGPDRTGGGKRMNQQETLALFAQGRDAWNAWTKERLAER